MVDWGLLSLGVQWKLLGERERENQQHEIISNVHVAAFTTTSDEMFCVIFAHAEATDWERGKTAIALNTEHPTSIPWWR